MRAKSLIPMEKSTFLDLQVTDLGKSLMIGLANGAPIKLKLIVNFYVICCLSQNHSETFMAFHPVHSTRILGAAALMSLLTACGGGGGGGPAPVTNISISGTGAKGVLKDAEVKAYEVFGGTRASTALAQTKTDANGNYTLSVPKTSNPVIIEVSTTSTTKMLDETQVTNTGEFVEIPAPRDLIMRGFASSASETVVVRVNPLTEAAVAIAAQAKDTNGKSVGLKAEALRNAQQVVIDQLSPVGVNPFTAAPPTKWSGATAEQQTMAAFMAGVMKHSSDLKVNISNLSKDVALEVSTDGTAKLSGTTRGAMNQLRKDLLQTASTNANVSAAVKQIAQSEAAKAPISSVDATTDAKVVEATEGFRGFMNALRDGFKATDSALQDTVVKLEQTYTSASSDALGYISSAIGRVLDDCSFPSTGGFACRSTGYTTVKWTSQGNNTFKVEATSPDFRRVYVATVAGVRSAIGGTIIISNATVKSNDKASKLLGEISSVTIELSRPSANDSESLSAVANGSIKVYDEKSLLTATLSSNNLTVFRAGTEDNIRGDLTLDVSNGDKLVGQAEFLLRRSDDLLASIKLSLNAVNQGAAVASLAVEGSNTPPANVAKPISISNWGPRVMKFDLGLPKGTSLSLEMQNTSFSNSSHKLAIKTSANEVVLNANYVQTYQPNYLSNWCEELDAIYRCASSITVTTTGGAYSATITKQRGQPVGNIKRGDTVVGKVINGIIQIDGVEVSLY
jgi:hypothetical protein